jgi:vesicle coat complex subunit
MIRKKAVIVIIKFHKIYPSAIDQMDMKMKKALCDKDPSVMAASLNYFSDQVKQRPLNIDYRETMIITDCLHLGSK